MKRTVNGATLFVRDWPAATPRGRLLVIHGLGEHSGRYDAVAAALNALGVSVRAYDQRGFGRSSGSRATLPHRDALLDDARVLFDELAADARGAGEPPPMLLGHSMGGLVAARAVTGGWIAPSALVLSSPALRTRLNAAARFGVRLAARVVPDLRAPHGLPLDKLSHDPAVLAAVTSDPLNHDRATPRLIAFMLDAGDAARRDAPSLAVPTLLIVAGDDRLVDPTGSREFAAAAATGLVTLRWFDGAYHELFHEREPERGEAFAALRAWVGARMGSGR